MSVSVLNSWIVQEKFQQIFEYLQIYPEHVINAYIYTLSIEKSIDFLLLNFKPNSKIFAAIVRHLDDFEKNVQIFKQVEFTRDLVYAAFNAKNPSVGEFLLDNIVCDQMKKFALELAVGHDNVKAVKKFAKYHARKDLLSCSKSLEITKILVSDGNCETDYDGFHAFRTAFCSQRFDIAEFLFRFVPASKDFLVYILRKSIESNYVKVVKFLFKNPEFRPSVNIGKNIISAEILKILFKHQIEINEDFTVVRKSKELVDLYKQLGPKRMSILLKKESLEKKLGKIKNINDCLILDLQKREYITRREMDFFGKVFAVLGILMDAIKVKIYLVD